MTEDGHWRTLASNDELLQEVSVVLCVCTYCLISLAELNDVVNSADCGYKIEQNGMQQKTTMFRRQQTDWKVYQYSQKQ